MKTQFMEQSERKLLSEFDPHTNYVLAYAIYVIGVGANSHL